MDKPRILKRLSISIAITLVFIALFVAFVPAADILDRFRKVELSWVYLPLFLLAALGNIYVRGKVLALIVNSPSKVSSSTWLAISTTHNLSTSLSGLVFGDAFLFWLMSRFRIHWKTSLFTTLLARVFELPPLVLALFCGLLLVPAVVPAQHLLVVLVGCAFVVSWIALFQLDRFIGLVPRRLQLGREESLKAFRESYGRLTERCMRPLMLLSFVKILLSLLYFVFALKFFNVELSFAEICLLFGIFNFATVIPVQGLAGLGTFEAYFSIGPLLLGWPASEAMAIAFQVHMLFLGSFFLLTLLSYFPVIFTGTGGVNETSA